MEVRFNKIDFFLTKAGQVQEKGEFSIEVKKWQSWESLDFADLADKRGVVCGKR